MSDYGRITFEGFLNSLIYIFFVSSNVNSFYLTAWPVCFLSSMLCLELDFDQIVHAHDHNDDHDDNTDENGNL